MGRPYRRERAGYCLPANQAPMGVRMGENELDQQPRPCGYPRPAVPSPSAVRDPPLQENDGVNHAPTHAP